MKELSLENPMAAPKLEKIIINMGVGEATQNAKVIDPAVAEVDPDHRPEAGRHQGEEIDCAVQGPRRAAHRRHGYAARRPHVRILRSPDERGSAARSRLPRRVRPSRSTDAAITRSGLRDQLIFPEIDYAKVEKQKGMNVTIVTTAKTDDQARALLKHMGMPFRPAIVVDRNVSDFKLKACRRARE